jgi:protein-disulfide isomerase
MAYAMNRRRSFQALAFGALLVVNPFAPWAQAQDLTDAASKMLAAASPLGDRVLGQADAAVVMVEYASATCPHCAEFHEKVLPLIKTEYIDTGKVRFIFREFPLDDLAMGAFMLARCLPDDKYFPTIDMMFRRQETWMKSANPADELFKIMQLSGMDQPAFEACLKRRDLSNAIFESSKKASEDFEIKGTPAIFVNGQMIDGHKEMTEVKAAIDAAIKKVP